MLTSSYEEIMNRYRVEHNLIVLLPLVASWIAVMFSGIPRGSAGLHLFEIAMFAGGITGVIALFYKYIQGSLLWYVTIILPILLAFVLYTIVPLGISIFALVMPNLAYALLSLALVRFVFYSKALFRLRTLLMGVGGAFLLSGYLGAIQSLMGAELPPGFWNAVFINCLIIYVFIAFSMSMADLIILQLEVKRLKKEDHSEDD
jgi:hypothetical protein